MPLVQVQARAGSEVEFGPCKHGANVIGPYWVLPLPDFGFVVGYYAEEEPIDDREQEDAWALIECVAPGIRDTSLASVMETHRDGKTAVIEIYTPT